MKKKLLLLYFLSALNVIAGLAQGLPFVRNYTSEDYGAHNRNFDIETGNDGTVYVANFEGLLYFDHAEWRMIHTPGITRINVVKRDRHGVIWVGGYNYIGRVAEDSHGNLRLHQIGRTGFFRGEIETIWEAGEAMFFKANNGEVYKIENDHVAVISNPSRVKIAYKNTVLNLGEGITASVREGEGLILTDTKCKRTYTMSEANGLCSNVVTNIAFDGKGQLWGATDNGIFCIAIFSEYSRFMQSEGLLGEVLSMEMLEGTMYVGTSRGLFVRRGNSFAALPGIKFACWQLVHDESGLLAATSDGVYHISADGVVGRISSRNTMSVLAEGPRFYTGEIDGVYLMGKDGYRQKVCSQETVTKMLRDDEGTIWLQSIYGQVWSKSAKDNNFKSYSTGNSDEKALTIVGISGDVVSVSAEAVKPFPYPQFSYADDEGVTWLTDNKGKNLYAWKNGAEISEFTPLLHPLRDITIRAMYRIGSEIWIGCDDGVCIADASRQSSRHYQSRLHIRSAVLGGDSILWGGYGKKPDELSTLSSDDRNLRFTYSLDYEPLNGATLYRYRLNDDSWTAWSTEHDAEFVNLPYGSYTLCVQASYATGEMSEVVRLSFEIEYPFYMRWYMIVVYVLLLAMLVYMIFLLRLRSLRQDKLKLEHIVSKRTSEILRQKDEIEEKSKSLAKALEDLGNAQDKLIRQEKMATVGKLTKGLIDRILNPINYINNFSKLSESLVKDIESNIDDEKNNMDEDNYVDTKDVINMLLGNLQKVGEHGQNTTRMLKAMEEMLKVRTGGYVAMDLASVVKQDVEMLHKYYESEIKEYDISIDVSMAEDSLMIHGNPELMSKTLMSMLSNSIYAIVKKAQRVSYDARISLSLTSDGDNYHIVIRDNGIGIEDAIISKIFDPFFTTKTTGEAAGVGLYLSRDIIQNHGGEITVTSVKNEYSEFTIVIPVIKV